MNRRVGNATARRMAGRQAQRIGQEVVLARANLGLAASAIARLAGVAVSTERRVELGDPSITMMTAARVLQATGLELAARAYPSRPPSLRDSGQLRLAERLRELAPATWRVAIEVPIEGGRSADVVLFGADQIIHVEIERRLADFQAQFRAALAKRESMQTGHRRPVRLVLAVEDTAANRRRLSEHESVIRHALPADSRAVLRAVRSGTALATDGLLWLRRRPAA
ncbi:MAG: hypothetical protein ABI622_11225 [Chloroflexota bacterium]